MPKSTAIDAALIGLLQADATLRALVPDGVFYGVAPPNAKRFVVVSLSDPVDRSSYSGREVEDNGYLVKAVGLSTLMTTTDSDAAFDRIDELLSDQPLMVSGYDIGAVYRDENHPRVKYPEPTNADASIVWHHNGGGYRVHVSLPN